MGTHARLGEASAVQALSVEDGLLRLIVDVSCSWPEGAAGRARGLVRLLGGGFMVADA